MDSIKKAFDWVLTSSADPSDVSLTIKGFLLGLVPAAMSIAGVGHIALSSDLLTTIVNDIALVVQYFLALVAAVSVMWGALRKVYYMIVPSKAPTTPTV